MNLFTRAVARDFRALFARCIAGRPRAPAPPVVVQIADRTHTIAATTPDGVILAYTAPAPQEANEHAVLPAVVLGEVEGGSDEMVILDRPSKLQGVMRWSNGGEPRTLPIELTAPGKQHEIPTLPSLTSVPAKLLSALHECGRSTARENGRYALSMVQLQGKAGRVVGTDGKVALFYKGFDFPFSGSFLVSALPVFGAKPLARVSEVMIGQSASRLVIRMGPWAVWLPFNATAKYPDVAAVLPKSAPTTVQIDERDAAELFSILPRLPGADHEFRPVTIDVSRFVRVRTQGEDKVSKQITLLHSTSAGPAMRVVLDRRVLARALSLGCHTLKLTPEKPVVAVGDELTLIAAQLDPVLIVRPTNEAAEPAIKTVEPNPVPLQSERSNPMKPEANGHAAPRDEPPDALILAEELRDALADATTKATRLVAALRHMRKEKKALSNVFSTLRQLNLDSGGLR